MEVQDAPALAPALLDVLLPMTCTICAPRVTRSHEGTTTGSLSLIYAHMRGLTVHGLKGGGDARCCIRGVQCEAIFVGGRQCVVQVGIQRRLVRYVNVL